MMLTQTSMADRMISTELMPFTSTWEHTNIPAAALQAFHCAQYSSRSRWLSLNERFRCHTYVSEQHFFPAFFLKEWCPWTFRRIDIIFTYPPQIQLAYIQAVEDDGSHGKSKSYNIQSPIEDDLKDIFRTKNIKSHKLF